VPAGRAVWSRGGTIILLPRLPLHPSSVPAAASTRCSFPRSRRPRPTGVPSAADGRGHARNGEPGVRPAARAPPGPGLRSGWLAGLVPDAKARVDGYDGCPDAGHHIRSSSFPVGLGWVELTSEQRRTRKGAAPCTLRCGTRTDIRHVTVSRMPLIILIKRELTLWWVVYMPIGQCHFILGCLVTPR
jgi:hypothetical protein